MDTKKIRKCSYLLPDPGGEVVRELLDEIERLQQIIQSSAERLETYGGQSEPDSDIAYRVLMAEVVKRKGIINGTP